MIVKYTNPFPSPEQELLLKAALFNENEAVKAWQQWNQVVNFEGYFDHASFRLLPLVYKNLSHLKPEVLFAGKLKNVYLQSWYKNQNLFYFCSQVTTYLSENQVYPLILKGIPLSILAYKDRGARPMSDIDMMIQLHEAERTLRLLREQGWMPENEEYIEYNLQYGKSICLKNDQDIELDIHWYPFFEAHGKAGVNDFTDRKYAFKVNDVQLYSLSPSDMLIHVITHGLHYNPEPPIRWIPDCLMLFRNLGDQIDWEYFYHQMIKFGITLKVKLALGYLKETFHLQIHENAEKILLKAHVSYRERIIYKNSKLIEEEKELRFFRKLFQLYLIYLQQSGEKGILKQMIGYIKFLRFRTHYENPLKVLYYHIFVKRKQENKY